MCLEQSPSSCWHAVDELGVCLTNLPTVDMSQLDPIYGVWHVVQMKQNLFCSYYDQNVNKIAAIQ